MALIDNLLKFGFITGSHAFGTAKEDSDLDIVYSIQDSKQIADILGSRETKPSNYFSGYSINYHDTIINLIPVHPHDFFPWWLATKAVAATLKASGIVDPIKKYALFQAIMSMFRGLVQELGNLNQYDSLKREILDMEAKHGTFNRENEDNQD